MKDNQESFEKNTPMDDYDSSERPERRRKAVYTIIEREGNKSYWLRLGTAFTNRDDSLTVYLNALPSNSKLHIRNVPESNSY